MRRFDPSQVFDPMQPVNPHEVSRVLVEKVRFAVGHLMSEALLQEISVRPDRIDYVVNALTYRLEAVLYGRECREEIVERRAEKSKEETSEESRKGLKHLLVPKTWLDHLKETFRQWCYGKGWAKLARLVKRVDFVTHDVQIEHKTVRNVTNVTKHIEVHKHWHICPHLDIKTNRPHLEFLMDRFDLR